MKNISIDFHLKRNIYSEFIIDLYRYLLEFKQCIYVKLIIDQKISDKLEANILSEIFESYTCQNLKDSIFYLESFYNETTDSFWEEAAEKYFDEYEVTYTSFRDSKLIEGVISDFSYSNIKVIQKLGYNQIMLYTKINDYDSMILGVYDYETLFYIDDVDGQEINIIKELFSSKFNIKNLKINIYEDNINNE